MCGITLRGRVEIGNVSHTCWTDSLASHPVLRDQGSIPCRSYARDKDDRKSQTGYVFMINNGPVSWTSHKQTSVALSTMEAEYMSLSDVSREAIARIHLYSDLDVTTASSSLLYSDSTLALSLTDESAPYQRSKHIDTRYHYIRDTLEKCEIQVDYVPSEENLGDVFTKALNVDSHHRCILGMGLRSVYGR